MIRTECSEAAETVIRHRLSLSEVAFSLPGRGRRSGKELQDQPSTSTPQAQAVLWYLRLVCSCYERA